MLALLVACTGRRHVDPADAGLGPAVHATIGLPSDKDKKLALPKEPEPSAAPVPCPVTDKQDLDAALDEAARRLDKSEFAVGLACAEQAVRISPRSVEAHHDRADALAGLEKWEDAKTAYTMALALDPDDPQTLASAADFYVNRLSPEHELAALGLEYARRGSAHVGRRREDKDLAARLALYEAEALDDLGRSDEALRRVDVALSLGGTRRGETNETHYQKALILFHLCKLDRASKAFAEVLSAAPDDAYAHHHLGLTLERLGREKEAEAHLLRAHQIAPAQFPDPILVPMDEFRKLVDAAVEKLPPAQRKLLDGVKIEIMDLPEMADLTAVDPPFPPTILGLYRGAPLGEPSGGEARAIVFYRKNLGRAVTTREELVKQVSITLLHEMGHLTGEDEDELRARGLE